MSGYPDALVKELKLIWERYDEELEALLQRQMDELIPIYARHGYRIEADGRGGYFTAKAQEGEPAAVPSRPITRRGKTPPRPLRRQKEESCNLQ